MEDPELELDVKLMSRHNRIRKRIESMYAASTSAAHFASDYPQGPVARTGDYWRARTCTVIWASLSLDGPESCTHAQYMLNVLGWKWAS